jgi:hypothetical protein
MTLTKHCLGCDQDLPLTEFYDKWKWCKECGKTRRRPITANPPALRAATQRYRAKHPERVKEQRRRYNATARARLLAAYGGRCACCGESTPEFLTLDHIHGIPDHHRRNGKRISGTLLYSLVLREGCPDDYQLLCWNCNAAKSYYGVCPHKRLKLVEVDSA